MTTADVLYLALLAMLLSVDHFVLWPAFLRRSNADPGPARLWLWSAWIILLWTLGAFGVALWLFEARAWVSLRFITPHGWRLWVAICLVLLLALAYARIVVRIARRKRPKRVRMGSPHAEQLAPHTPFELGWWVAVSMSAGFWEEFIFRGYLIWAFQPMFGLWGSAAFSIVVFAVAHAYQGGRGVLATGSVGTAFTLVVLISGSLWPAIALHVLVDIGQGLVAWLALRKVHADGGGSPALAAEHGS